VKGSEFATRKGREGRVPASRTGERLSDSFALFQRYLVAISITNAAIAKSASNALTTIDIS